MIWEMGVSKPDLTTVKNIKMNIFKHFMFYKTKMNEKQI